VPEKQKFLLELFCQWSKPQKSETSNSLGDLIPYYFINYYFTYSRKHFNNYQFVLYFSNFVLTSHLLKTMNILCPLNVVKKYLFFLPAGCDMNSS